MECQSPNCQRPAEVWMAAVYATAYEWDNYHQGRLCRRCAAEWSSCVATDGGVRVELESLNPGSCGLSAD